jgi:tRNA threonylcarbamoyladenosine biosynthesis protein TsaB
VILAIDGASTELSIALADPGGEPIVDESWTSAQRQSAELLPRTLDLLGSAGRGVREVTVLAIGTGPGSFTGLRVALSLGKGLAFALDRPIVGIPSLAAWLEQEPAADAAVARAGAREAYLLIRGEMEPLVVDRDGLAERLAGREIVAPAELVEAFGLSAARPPAAAVAVARLAARHLAADPAGDDLRRLEPMYLRAPRGLPAKPATEIRWL